MHSVTDGQTDERTDDIMMPRANRLKRKTVKNFTMCSLTEFTIQKFCSEYTEKNKM